MEPFLHPIEKPQGLVTKLAYFGTRKQFGKVPTPVKVMFSRMPSAFGLFISKIARLDKKLELPVEAQMLVRERVARINICEFCMDIGRYFVIKSGLNEDKFDAINDYTTSPLFSDAERAMLDYVTELTRDKNVKPETFARLAIPHTCCARHLHRANVVGSAGACVGSVSAGCAWSCSRLSWVLAYASSHVRGLSMTIRDCG